MIKNDSFVLFKSKQTGIYSQYTFADPHVAASLYLDFNKYGWVYIGGAIFLLVILAYSVNKCCCRTKNEKEPVDLRSSF